MKILGMGIPELLIMLVVIGVPVLVVVLIVRASKKKRQQEPSAPDMSESTCDVSQTNSPVLDAWKTSVGFSVLGAIVGFFVMLVLVVILATGLSIGIASLVGSASSMASDVVSAFASALTIPIACILWYVLGIVYATVFYPSYFTEKPKVKSSRAISFLNFTFGEVVFGALWNRDLTKKAKGTSHTVFVVLTALMLAYMAFSAGATIVQGVNYTQQVAPIEKQADKGDTPEGKADFIEEHRAGYSFEMPTGWVEQQFYEGVASFGYEGSVALNIEERQLDGGGYPSADEQMAFLQKQVTNYSKTSSEGSALDYEFSDKEPYQLDGFAMLQATMNVRENGTLQAKHSVLLFFVSESEYVTMMYLSEPEDYEATSAIANRIFESVRLA